MTLLQPAAGLDLAACLATLGTPPQVPGVEKDQHDIWRYEKIIAATRPDILIECGTHTGHSALWFSALVPLVITIDLDQSKVTIPSRGNILRVTGNSADNNVMAAISRCIGPLDKHRIMVSLDSDHSAVHVRSEIQTWAHMVTVGCYLVVEDGIFHWAPKQPDQADWDPLPAISAALPQRPDYIRDYVVESMFPITGAVAGWWRRVRERPVYIEDTRGRL